MTAVQENGQQNLTFLKKYVIIIIEKRKKEDKKMWRIKEFAEAYNQVITIMPNFPTVFEIVTIALWHIFN